MASKEERNKTLVLEAFNTLFNKRDYAYTNRPEADLDVFS
ncbi:hypothetical protein V1283_002418 [Bradyrhizobium sp. AZCC 2262]|jgi:hypothetical protein